MLKSLLIALLGAAFTCATLSAQDQPLIHQPTLTPQDSGTTNGLIAVSPVNVIPQSSKEWPGLPGAER